MAFFHRLMTAIKRQTIVQLLMSFANISEPMVAFTHLPVYFLLFCSTFTKSANRKRSAERSETESDVIEKKMKTATSSQKLLSIDTNAKMRAKSSRSKKANKSPDFVRKKVIALNLLQKKMITSEPNAPKRAAKERINSKKKQLQKKKSFSRTLRPPVITSVTVAPAPLPPRGFSFSISQDSVQLKSIVRSSSTPTAQKSVSFGTCILRYFKRSHGTCVIPEETGDATTLGLGEEYPFSTIHYQLSSIIDNDEDSLWRSNKAYRSTKLSIRERQMLLLAAGVQLNSNVADECRVIQRSRQRIGCSCRGRCDATRCECMRNGINCQSSPLKSQIACCCDPMRCGQRVNAVNQTNSSIYFS